MARIGRGYPTRRCVTWRIGKIHQNLTFTDAFETEAEFPQITVTTPDVFRFLDTFETEAEFPYVENFYGRTVEVASFETASEWPELTVVIPILPGDGITAAGQVELLGTVWGPGTSVEVLTPIEGWRSTPTIDNLNVAKPSQHGAWGARKLAQQRLVTIRLQPNSSANPSQIDDLLDGIDAVTGIAEDETPIPLVIRAHGSPQLAYGQVVDRNVDLDVDYNVGRPTVSILIACADPRRYSLGQTGVAIPVSTGVEVTNAGNVATHPIIRIDGPVVNPSINNSALSRLLSFTLTLTTGQQLIIDTAKGIATVAGASVMSTLTNTSAPVADWVIGRGTTTITYAATSGGTTFPLTLLYRDAWI